MIRKNKRLNVHPSSWEPQDEIKLNGQENYTRMKTFETKKPLSLVAIFFFY